MFITQESTLNKKIQSSVQSMVSQTESVSISETCISESSVSESVISEPGVSDSKRSVVDERSWSRDNPGSSSDDGGISLSLPSVSRGSSHSSEVSSSGLSNLRSDLRGDQRLRVEGRSDSIIDWGHRKTRVFHTESSSISHVVD